MRKLFLTFLALIVQLCAWASDGDYYKYTISPSTGTLSRTSGTGDWKNKWVSTAKVDDGTEETKALKLTADNYNFKASGEAALDMRSGNGNTSTYTLTAPAGYLIASYQFTYKGAANSVYTIKIGDKYYPVTTEARTIDREYLVESTMTFTLTGNNNELLFTNFTVEVVKKGSDLATLANGVKTAVSNARSDLNGYSEIFGDNLITQASQYSSPYTCSSSQDSNGADVANLLDGNSAKYWHSDWSSNVNKDTHYLQVSIEDVEADVDMLFVTLGRRTNIANDHPIQLRVKGYKENNPSLTFDQGHDLGVLTFPYTPGATDRSREYFNAFGYKYLRFYWEASNGTYQRGYWHCTSFQLNNCEGLKKDLKSYNTYDYEANLIYYLPYYDLNNSNITDVINALGTCHIDFSSAERATSLGTITWYLKDAQDNTIMTEKRRNCKSGTTYSPTMTMTGFSLDGASVKADGTNQTKNITFAPETGFPYFISSVADINQAKWYNINVRDKYVIYDAASNTFYDTDANAPDPDNKNGWFAFVGDPEVGFKIFNYGGACAFGSDNVDNDKRIQGVREAEAATYLFEKQNNNTWQVRDVRGANAFLNQQATNLGIWNVNGDAGNKFEIEGVTVKNADIAQYLVTVDITATDAQGNNPITWRADKFYKSGEPTVVAPKTSYSFFTNSYTLVEGNANISAENLHFNYTTTHTMPFVEGKFYQIKTRDKSSYLQYLPAGTTESGKSYAEGVYTKASTSNASADHLWYFKRKNNTPDYYTLHAVAVDKGIAGASMSTTPTEYQILKSTYGQAGEDGFVLAVGNNTLGGHQKYNNYTTVQGSQISHWGGGKGNLDNEGNCFWVEEFDESIFNYFSQEEAPIADQPLVGAYTGTTGQYATDKTACNTYTSVPTLANLRNALSPFTEGRIVDINPNKYYQFVAKESVGNTGRVMYATPCCTTTGGGLDFERNIKIGNDGTTASIPASAFKFQEVAGGYKIEHVNSKYWIAQLGGFGNRGILDLPISNDNAGIYLIENVTGQTSTIWSLRDKDDNTKYIHSGDTGDGKNILVSTEAPTVNKGCRWAIREITQVPVSVSEVKWATLCLPMPVTIPSDADLEVYYISEITSDGILTLMPIDGGTTVAKETPMLLYSSAASLPKTYNFAVSTATGTSYPSNKLSGSTARRKGFSTTDSEYYGLANKEGVVGFYPSTSEIIAANKAYLLNSQIPPKVQNGARALLFSTDGDTETGITATEATTPDLQGTIYDMYGRQVKKMQRGGIYIINGTKVIVK